MTMRYSLLSWLLPLALSNLLFTAPVWSGGMISAGTETPWPWFTGSGPVTYCVERSERFSLPLEGAVSLITKRLANWSQFVSSLNDTQLREIFGDTVPQFSTRFELRDCASGVELRFHLGTFPAEVMRVFDKIPGSYSSVNVKIARNSITQHAQGFIWFEPDLQTELPHGRARHTVNWNNEAEFSHALDEELSFIFGFATP